MDPVLIDLLPELSSAGDTIERAAHLDWPSYTLGDKEYSLDKGLDYNVLLTHTGEGILLSGLLRAQVSTDCDRCLDPAHFELASEVESYFVREIPVDAADEEQDFELIVDDKVDIAPALLAALALDTPYVSLCKDDCKGLCPHCGANLNHESCECSQAELDPFNPFSKLAQLKQDLERS